MSQFGGVERPGSWETIGDHERRIRALEGVPDCCDEDCTTVASLIAGLVADGNDLLGYWRLGEASGDFLDTSGQAMPADATIGAGSTALTRHVTGALPADQDDGAIRLNSSTGANSEFLEPDSGGDGPRFNLTNSDMTIVAFVKPTSGSASSFEGGIIGNLTTTGGWSLMVEWPTLTPIFIRLDGAGVTLIGPAITADEWTMIVATYDSVNGHRLYYNGAEVASDPTIFTGLPSINQDPVIGLAGEGLPSLYKSFYGALDEISVWEAALTPAEISSLYVSSQGCPTCESVDSTENVGMGCGVRSENGTTPEPEGRVLTADGEGGSTWAAEQKLVELKIFDDATTLATGDGKLIWCIPEEWDAATLVNAHAFVTTVSSSGTPTVQVRNVTGAVDMLSTAITIDASEFTSYTATTPPVINTSNDQVATGDLIAIDVDAAGTGAKGLGVILTLELP